MNLEASFQAILVEYRSEVQELRAQRDMLLDAVAAMLDMSGGVNGDHLPQTSPGRNPMIARGMAANAIERCMKVPL